MSTRLISPAHGFGRTRVDRSRRLTFRLDGIEINGFAGDTVLSAALAAGIDGAGHVGGAALRLSLALAPNVRIWEKRQSAGVPMALCPAANGLDFITVGARDGKFARLMAQLRGRPRQSLGVDFARLPSDDVSVDCDDRARDIDLLVIGGGVAGMSAALEGARHGLSVMLVEQRGRFGGDAALFGNCEGEPPVLDAIAALEAQIASEAGIETRLLCRAIDAGAAGVTLVRVAGQGADLARDTERIAARRVVITTGCADRLPIHPGNRLPGVVGLAEAFDFAGSYGVWPQGPTLFAGGTNALYHLAMLAKESGAGVIRLVDHRAAPHSRFVDFAKASGIPQEFGTRVSAVAPTGDHLAIRTTLAWYDSRSEGRGEFAAGSVVGNDGWRPRLSLWAKLGGDLQWGQDGAAAAGNAVGDSVALAGSAAGLVTTSGCRQSGERAVAALLGRITEPVVEDCLADYIESPDAATLRALPSSAEPAFTSSSRVFVAMPASAGEGQFAKSGFQGASTDWLDFESIDALTRAGLSPSDCFVAVCAERLITVRTIAALEAGSPEPLPGEIPPYLSGRFDGVLQRVRLTSEDGRTFEPGILVFADSGTHQPEEAIGVVVASVENGGDAGLIRSAIQELARVTVRDGARPLSAMIAEENEGKARPGKVETASGSDAPMNNAE